MQIAKPKRDERIRERYKALCVKHLTKQAALYALFQEEEDRSGLGLDRLKQIVREEENGTK